MHIHYPKALYIVRLHVYAASIVSSHLTWGFPAPSAFTGFVEQLNRSLAQDSLYQSIDINGVGVICHRLVPQVTRLSPYRHAPLQLNLLRQPLNHKGETAPIIEEGKGNLELSLVIGLSGDGLVQHLSGTDELQSTQTLQLITKLDQLVYNMRLAGGSIFPHKRKRSKLLNWSQSTAIEKTQALRRHLLPGFALLHRHEVLLAHQHWLQQYFSTQEVRDSDPDLLDTLLDICRLNIKSTEQKPKDDDHEVKALWRIRQRASHLTGWLVPIPIGYAALTDVQRAGSVAGSRDNQTPIVFAETLLSLGEWLGAHKINDLAEILWAYQAKPQQGLYQLTQPFAVKKEFQPTVIYQYSSEFETDENELESEDF